MKENKEKKITKEKIKYYAKRTISFILNPRFLICFGIGWMITNGWSYVMFSLGTIFEIEWMQIVAGAYLAFLWLPMTPEKIITLAIAIVLLKFLFPNDKKTLGVLQELYRKTVEKLAKKKNNRKQKKNKETKND